MNSFLLVVAVLACAEQSFQHAEWAKDPVHPAWTSYNSSDKCQAILRKEAKPFPFAMIAHTLHAMTLRDVRRYFDATATEENFVITLKERLPCNTGKTKPSDVDAYIQQHALDTAEVVDAPCFETQGMKTLDLVMSQKAEGPQAAYETVGKIVHAFHMEELYNAARDHYKIIHRAPPSNETCDCVLDAEHNGIKKFLRIVGLGLMYEELDEAEGCTSRVVSLTKLPALYYEVLRDYNANITSNVKRAGTIKDSIPQFWNNFKTNVFSGGIYCCPNQDSSYNTALYMYCAIRKAHGGEVPPIVV